MRSSWAAPRHRRAARVKRLRITRLGGWCAVAVLPLFLAGAVLLAGSGAADVLPASGRARQEWLAAVASDERFAAGAWLIVLMGFLVMVAFVGLYFVLRQAGEVLIVAPVLGVAGMTLVQVSQLIPIAMSYELAPAYLADGADRPTLAATADTFAALSQVTNAAGNALAWGVAVPLYAWAILSTRTLSRWIGWLGMVVAIFGGWLGLLSPASSLAEDLSGIGFLTFFIFVFSTGIAVLRLDRRPRSALFAPPDEPSAPPSRNPRAAHVGRQRADG